MTIQAPRLGSRPRSKEVVVQILLRERNAGVVAGVVDTATSFVELSDPVALPIKRHLENAVLSQASKGARRAG